MKTLHLYEWKLYICMNGIDTFVWIVYNGGGDEYEPDKKRV